MSELKIRVDPESMGFDPTRLQRIQTHFDAYVADGRLPGWLATVSRGDELVWVGKSGYRNREEELDVTDDTIWRIYSMTKPIVSIAAMMLYEEGVFDLNDDVGQWIEELREPRIFVGAPPLNPETEPAHRSSTCASPHDPNQWTHLRFSTQLTRSTKCIETWATTSDVRGCRPRRGRARLVQRTVVV